MTTSCYPLSLVSAGACRAEDLIEHQVGRQVNSEWKHERQKCQEPKRWNSSLRSLTKPVNPIDIPLRVAEQIRERQYDSRDKRLREESALIVTEPVKHPDEKQWQPHVE